MKACQQQARKETKDWAQEIGERLFIDISSLKTRTFVGNWLLLLIVDNVLDMCWSYFFKKKSDLPDKMITHVKILKIKYDVQVQKIHMDNAGENIAFERECLRKGMSIDFEYTTPGTPHYNGQVKRKLVTLYNKMRVMMIFTGFN